MTEEYWNGVIGVTGMYDLEDPAIKRWQEGLREKYAEYTADLATQWRGWRTLVHHLVVGDLASLGGFREELDKTHLLSKREISFPARN